jgi:hypothetical protein
MSEPDPFKISEAVIDLWRCYTIERDMAKELEAENARLRSVAEDNKRECEATRIENARLKAEVDRLTKAGDAMHNKLCWCYLDGYRSTKEAEEAWNAAKEGKPQP